MEPHVRPYHPNSADASPPRGPRANRRQSTPPPQKMGERAVAPHTPNAPKSPQGKGNHRAKAEPKPRARRPAAAGSKRGKSAAPARAVVSQPPSASAREQDVSTQVMASEPPIAIAVVDLDGAEPANDVTQVAETATDTSAETDTEPSASPVIAVGDFEDIFTRFQTPIINFVYRLVGNREQAFDLAQDVFVKAYRALAAGATIQAGALSSWLYRIASNTATDALRRRRLISWLPLSLFNDDRGVGAGMPGSDSGFGMPVPTDEHMVNAVGAFSANYDGGRFEQRVADQEIVERVLKRLPEKYAACLLLYEHEGYSCAEIAEVLNVTPSAVKMRLMRARERFISLYQQELEGRR